MTPRRPTAPTSRVHEVDEFDDLIIRVWRHHGSVLNGERAIERSLANPFPDADQERRFQDWYRVIHETTRAELAACQDRLIALMRAQGIGAVRYHSTVFVDGTAPPLGIDTSGLIVVRLDD